MTVGPNAVYLSLAVEHLRGAIGYADRGRSAFFDTSVPDTYLLVECELRKAFESLNRLGQVFYRANPRFPAERIGEVRQLLTHDYAELDRAEVWKIATRDAPRILRLALRAKIPEE